jgi:hypothetical protein
MARWWAVVEAESPISLAAVVNGHPCSPSNRSTAKRVGEAMARATITIFSMSNVSRCIETSARFCGGYAAVAWPPSYFDVHGFADPGHA